MAIKDIVLPNGEHIVIDEWLHYPIFSTVEWAAASNPNLRAFSYTRGQNVPQVGLTARIANEMDTNQVVKNRMNHDEAFVCYAITYEPFALSNSTVAISQTTYVDAPAPVVLSTNLDRLRRDLMVELIIGAGITKPQVRCPFSYLRQGVGAVAWGTGDSLNAGLTHRPSYGTGGHIHSQNERRFTLPILIESDRTMFMRLFSPFGAIAGLTQDMRLRMYLDGLKRRPIG